MRRAIGVATLALCAALCLSLASASQAARLVWTASTGAVQGYTVYYHDTGVPVTPETEYHRNLPSTPTEYDLAGLNLQHGKTYQFCLTAYNSAGESGRSNTVDYTVPAYAPPADLLPPVVIVIPGASVSIRVDP